ncbi:MAG: glutathione S-transferase [Burkholderiaceae bacterium]|nr:glutathione S-transferase [Burkholderiaceae bacterium]
MKLIGMLDSPYVRRVAVTLQLMGLKFEHQSLSVFSTYDQFRAINPVVKAPTLLADDGTVLMDSTIIIQYAEALAMPAYRMTPSMPTELLRSLRVLGVALAACDKAVQLVYEHKLRPLEKLHQPWVARVTTQLLEAFDALETELARQPLSLQRPDHAAVMTAVSWHFTQQMLGDVVMASCYPLLQAFSLQAEALPAFRAAPYGDGTYPVTAGA